MTTDGGGPKQVCRQIWRFLCVAAKNLSRTKAKNLSIATAKNLSRDTAKNLSRAVAKHLGRAAEPVKYVMTVRPV